MSEIAGIERWTEREARSALRHDDEAERWQWSPPRLLRSRLLHVTAEAERPLEAGMKLPDGERAQLAALLADSIGDDASDAAIEGEWLAEAKRRLDDVHSGRSGTIAWSDVHRKLRTVLDQARARRTSAG